MKKLKIYFILFICLIALALTSCGDSNAPDPGHYGELQDIRGLANKLAWLQSNAQSNASYVLEIDSDENIGPHILSYGSRNNITITIKGIGSNRTIRFSNDGAMFTVGNGVTLVLDDNISLTSRSNNARHVYVTQGGTLRLNTGATVTGNRPYGIVVGSGGTFTMTGGTISNTGTGVSVTGGNFTMAGGIITGNTYGGVNIDGGTFTMTSGTISGNTTSANGGGVLVSGTFNMNGGTIQGNTSNGGGGVYLLSGTFTMSGGTIQGNTAFSGGGVVILNGRFTMRGGSIDRNNGGSAGGGVHMWSGNFNMSNGTISGNTSDDGGGGVRVSDGRTEEGGGWFSKTGGIIYGYTPGDARSNRVTVGNNRGHAVYIITPHHRRETTAGMSIRLDSRLSGAAGGWEN